MAVKITNKSAPAQSIAQQQPTKAKKSRKRITNVGYAPEVFDRIFQYIAAGETLAEACRRPGMPNPTTVRRELWSKVVFGVRQGFEGGGGLAENVACRE